MSKLTKYDAEKEQATAWLAVVAVLNEVKPDWYFSANSGLESAVATIRYLADREKRAQAAQPEFQAIYFKRNTGIDRLIVPATDEPTDHVEESLITKIKLLYAAPTEASKPVQAEAPKELNRLLNEFAKACAFGDDLARRVAGEEIHEFFNRRATKQAEAPTASNEREAFEAEQIRQVRDYSNGRHTPHLERTGDGYQNPLVHHAWMGWQARAALATQQEAQPQADEKLLRKLLAIRVAGASLYGDDGELQDNSVYPCIDFKRDSALEIERKLLERGTANAWKSIAQHAAQAEPGAQHILSPEDADLLDRIVEDFCEDGETMVDQAELMRFANMGYLECERFMILPEAQDAIDAARAAQQATGERT